MASKSGQDAKTILVVDDDLENRRVYSEILRDLGYNVIDKANATAALSAIEGGARIDLVITDYSMPEMSGLEFVTQLRKALPLVPVLMITAYGNIENYFRSLSLGVIDYIDKPVGRREFVRIVQAALNEAGVS